jgi:hypothetical protein
MEVFHPRFFREDAKLAFVFIPTSLVSLHAKIYDGTRWILSHPGSQPRRSAMVNDVKSSQPRTDSAAPLPTHPRTFQAIAVGGVIVGVLDLIYAIVVYSPHKPILIPQTIASGLVGMKSYSGGIQTAVLGVVLHFVIALGAATVYLVASRKIAFLIRHAVVSGLIFGALVYGFMHLVVLPLSAAPQGHTALIYKVSEFIEHWFCVGLPIALSVRHYSQPHVAS